MASNRQRTVVIGALAAVVTAVASVALGVAGRELNAEWLAYAKDHPWLIVVLALLILVAAYITKELVSLAESSRGSVDISVLSPVVRRALERLLARVTQIDIVDNLHRRVTPPSEPLRITAWRTRSLVQDVESTLIPELKYPLGTVSDAAERSGYSLLVLGDPGSGKTTALLGLVEELARTAQEARSQDTPIPVFLELKSWRGEPLIDWIAAATQKKYRIGKSVVRELIQDGYVIPVLDGLDEVDALDLDRCVDKINRYLGRLGTPIPLVISCRAQDYNDVEVLLRLPLAAILQELELPDVWAFLHVTPDQYKQLTEGNKESDRQLRRPLRLKLAKDLIDLWDVAKKNHRGIANGELPWEDYLVLRTERSRPGQSPNPTELRAGLEWMAWVEAANHGPLRPDVLGAEVLGDGFVRWLPRHGVACVAGLLASLCMFVALTAGLRYFDNLLVVALVALSAGALIMGVLLRRKSQLAASIEIRYLRIFPSLIICALITGASYPYLVWLGSMRWDEYGLLPVLAAFYALVAVLSWVKIQYVEDVPAPGISVRQSRRNVRRAIVLLATGGGLIVAAFAAAVTGGSVRVSLGSVMQYWALLCAAIATGSSLSLAIEDKSDVARIVDDTSGWRLKLGLVGIAGAVVALLVGRCAVFVLNSIGLHWFWLLLIEILVMSGVYWMIRRVRAYCVRQWASKRSAVIRFLASSFGATLAGAALIDLALPVILGSVPPVSALVIGAFLAVGLFFVLAVGGAHLICRSLTEMLLRWRGVPAPVSALMVELNSRELVLRVGDGYTLLHPSLGEFLRARGGCRSSAY
jgi:hypothetical protein